VKVGKIIISKNRISRFGETCSAPQTVPKALFKENEFFSRNYDFTLDIIGLRVYINISCIDRTTLHSPHHTEYVVLSK
jgi:hypothetical protein